MAGTTIVKWQGDSISSRRNRPRVTLLLMVALVLGGALASAEAGGRQGGWYQTVLKTGEFHEFNWGVGAKGPRDQPLKRICLVLALNFPPEPGSPEVRGDESVNCGGIRSASTSVSASMEFGPPDSQITLLATLYRPIVRRVALLLSSGEERVFTARVPEVRNRSDKGIPIFRFVVARFAGEPCVRRITTYAGDGAVIAREDRPLCPEDTGNI
jgi:hypothetical protein